MKKFFVLFIVVSLFLGVMGTVFVPCTYAVSYNIETFHVPVPGAYSTRILGINDAGDIVGNYWDSSGSHGFLYRGTTLTTLDYPTAVGSYAEDIDSKGNIIGYYRNNTNDYQGFTYDGTKYTAITGPAAAEQTYLRGMNDSGYIAGYYEDSLRRSNGFIYNDPVFDVLTIPNASDIEVNGINNSGQMVGQYYNTMTNAWTAFSYDGLSLTEIPPEGSNYDNDSWATGINDAGIISIISFMAAGSHSKFWSYVFDGTDYSPLLLSGDNDRVQDINNSGTVVGFYEDPAASGYRGFIGHVVPVPPSMLLLGTGLIGLLGFRRKFRKR